MHEKAELHEPLGPTTQGQRRSLGTLGQFLKGKGIAKSDLTSNGVPCLRYAEIYTMYGDVIHELRSFVSHAVASKALYLERGDIVFATSGETNAEIGKAVAYLGNEKAVAGGDTVVLRGHGQDPSFLAYALNSEDAVRQKSRLGKGHSIAHIHVPELSRVEIWLPRVVEQRRIAGILSTWDAAVEATRRTRDLVALQYRAIAAKKIHLRGPNMRPLKDLLIPDRMQTVDPNGPFRALGVRSHGKGTFQREDDLTANGSTKTVYRVEADRFIVNIVFAWEGAAAITSQDDAGCLVSHRFPTFTINREALSLEYFRHLIRTEPFRQLLALASPGGAGRNKTLNRNDLLKFEIHVPPLPEQTAVATALGTLDRRITLLDEYLQRLTIQRDALATELLTGRLRVPQAEAAS